jgi:hypothetical protein
MCDIVCLLPLVLRWEAVNSILPFCFTCNCRGTYETDQREEQSHSTTHESIPKGHGSTNMISSISVVAQLDKGCFCSGKFYCVEGSNLLARAIWALFHPSMACGFPVTLATVRPRPRKPVEIQWIWSRGFCKILESPDLCISVERSLAV